ncbi:MAG: glycosyltransferase family A protein [Bacteroidota bacterium]
MSLFSLPEWIQPHLFTGKNFDDLSTEELLELKNRILRFKEEDPEVSVMIPAWNEENNIYRTISSLAASNTKRKVEIVVINNNSTDRTQQVLDKLGVKNYLQSIQGTPFARQMGLENAKGKFHLCADADTFYPPSWIDEMIAPMVKDGGITGVYGTHSFIPPAGKNRNGLILYEALARVFVQIRKKNREYLNVFGFNMGFVTDVGRSTGGFKVSGNRVYNNIVGSDYNNEAEDGRMALNLKTKGRLQQVTAANAKVFTSPRRLLDDGSIWKAFLNRAKVQANSMNEYITGKK